MPKAITIDRKTEAKIIKLLTSPVACKRICLKIDEDINFIDWDGKPVAFTRDLQLVSGRKAATTLLHDSRDYEYLPGVSNTIIKLITPEHIRRASWKYNQTENIFGGAVKARKYVVGFTSVAVLIIALTHKRMRDVIVKVHDLKFDIEEIPKGLKGRKYLFGLLKENQPKWSSPQSPTEKGEIKQEIVSINGESPDTHPKKRAAKKVVVTKTKKEEPVATTETNKDPLERPQKAAKQLELVGNSKGGHTSDEKGTRWDAPDELAICDASLPFGDHSGCAMAAFHPASMTAQLVHMDMIFPIDLLEMQAAALAGRKYRSKQIITDSRNALRAFDQGVQDFSKMGRFDFNRQTGHEYYTMKNLIMAGAKITWTPRKKNIIADYLANWSVRNRFTGKVKVRILEELNIANPEPKTENWIEVVPVIKQNIEGILERLHGERDGIVETISAYQTKLEVLDGYIEAIKGTQVLILKYPDLNEVITGAVPTHA